MKTLKKNIILVALFSYAVILITGSRSEQSLQLLEKQLFLNLWGILLLICGINLHIMRKNNPTRCTEDTAGAFCVFSLLSIIWCFCYFAFESWLVASGLSVVIVGVMNSAVMFSAHNGFKWCIAMIPAEIWSIFLVAESFLQYSTMG